MVKALVAEDNERVGHLLAQTLRDGGHLVDECWTGAEALRLGCSSAYDLLVLDTALTKVDGFTVCRTMRQCGVRTLILMLGATARVDDRVRGLESGADDFVVKPCAQEEFLARVHALLRRQAAPRKLVCGELEVDRLEGSATLAGRRLRCTAREFALLLHLAERQGAVVTPIGLFAAVWNASLEGSVNAVQVHICHLRAKMGAHAWMIETVRGEGYRLRSRPP